MSAKMCNFAYWHICHIWNNGKDYSSKYRNSSCKIQRGGLYQPDRHGSQPDAGAYNFRWLSLKSTIEYLGEWEMLYNPDFNCTEFGTIKNAAGSNSFVLSVKTWLERTNANRYTFKSRSLWRHIRTSGYSLPFGMWISPNFSYCSSKSIRD